MAKQFHPEAQGKAPLSLSAPWWEVKEHASLIQDNYPPDFTGW